MQSDVTRPDKDAAAAQHRQAPPAAESPERLRQKQDQNQDQEERRQSHLASSSPAHPPLLHRETLQSKYQQAQRRLFLLDYDGTLTTIVDDPNRALPSEPMLAALRDLVADPRNAVWVISGRDKQKLELWLDQNIPGNIGFSAEHGCFLRQPNQVEWEDLTGKEDMSWQDEVRSIFQRFAQVTEGSSIEEKQVALTWHYRRALDQEHAEAQARICRATLEERLCSQGYDRVEVILGKANLEVRPRFVNKGCITERLLREFMAHHKCYPDFLFCAGDDFTDEDMFRALNAIPLPADQAFSVSVGPSTKPTVARWRTPAPHDVIRTLASLASSTRPTSSSSSNQASDSGNSRLTGSSETIGDIKGDIHG